MRILAVVPFYPPFMGGAEQLIEKLMIGLDKFGYQCSVHSSDVLSLMPFQRIIGQESDGPVIIKRFRDWLGPKGFRFVTSLVASKTRGWLRFPPNLEALGRSIVGYPLVPGLFVKTLAEARNSDVIITGQVLWATAFVTKLVSELAGRPFVALPLFHAEHPVFEHKSTIELLRQSNGILVCSEWEKAQLSRRGVNSSKVRVMGPLYDPINPESVPIDSLISKMPGTKFLYLGRRDFDKGYFHFIHALSICIEKGHTVNGVIIGPHSPSKMAETDASIHSYIRQVQAMKIGLGSKLLDLGTLPNSSKLSAVKSCDVLVLPSRAESFGLVVLEAFNFMKPVIVSDRGPLPELASGGGLIVEWGNPDKLAAAMEILATNPNLRTKLGTEGFKRIAQFSSAQGLEVASKLLREVVKPS